MTSITARRDLSRPAKSRAETKAEITDRTARAIIDAEVRQRDAKTEKLRRVRLENEAREAAIAVTAKERPGKKPRARRTISSSAKPVAHKDTTA